MFSISQTCQVLPIYLFREKWFFFYISVYSILSSIWASRRRLVKDGLMLFSTSAWSSCLRPQQILILWRRALKLLEEPSWIPWGQTRCCSCWQRSWSPWVRASRTAQGRGSLGRGSRTSGMILLLWRSCVETVELITCITPLTRRVCHRRGPCLGSVCMGEVLWGLRSLRACGFLVALQTNVARASRTGEMGGWVWLGSMGAGGTSFHFR